MKTTLLILAACCAFLLPQLALAQPAWVLLDGSASLLTSDCLPYDGFNALADGTIIHIYADQNNNGADILDQPIVAGTNIGEWNFNQFPLNGAAALNAPGSFFPPTTLICKGTLAAANQRIFLVVLQPNNVDWWWWSSVYVITPGFQHIKPDSLSNWTCSPLPPVAPPGENCTNSIPIDSVPFVYSGSTTGLADDFNATGNLGPDQFFSLENLDSGLYVIDLCESSYKTAVEIIKGDSCSSAVWDSFPSGNCYGKTGGRIITKKMLEKAWCVLDGRTAADSGDFVLQIARVCGGQVVCPPSPVPPYVDTYDSPVSLPHWTAQGIAADESGILYLNDHSAVPAIYKGPPGGPFTTLTTQTTGGITNPPGAGGGVVAVDLGDMTWDASRSALWAGGLWEQAQGVWVGHGDVYQVDPNTGACWYRFTIPGVSDPVFGISWDRTDNSLWCAEYTGSSVRHVTTLATPVPGAPMPIWDSGNTQVTGITGICATNFGLWVTGRSSNNEITLHDKSDGSYAGETITTSCCELEGLECDPVNYPGCVLWCADLVYGNYTSYTIPDGSCTTGWRLGDNCGSLNVINSLPYVFAESMVGLNPDFETCGPPEGSDVIFSFTTTPELNDIRIELRADFDVDFEVRFYGACPGESLLVCGSDDCPLDPLFRAAIREKGVSSSGRTGQFYVIAKKGSPSDSGTVWGWIDYAGNDSVSVIGSLPFYDTGTTVGLYDDYDAECNVSPDKAYSLIAPATGDYVISLCGSAYNALLAVYGPGDSLLVTHDDGGCTGDTSGLSEQPQVIASLAEGVEYVVVVDGSDSVAGDFSLYIDDFYPLPLICPYPQLDHPLNEYSCENYDTLECGDTICAGIYPRGDEDWFHIYIPPVPDCFQFTIDVLANSTPYYYPFAQGLNPMIEMYDDCGLQILVGSDTDGGVGTDSRLVTECLDGDLSGRVLHFRVKAEQIWNSGLYVLALNCAPCVCDTCYYWNCDAHAEPINDMCLQDNCVQECGDTLCGTIDPAYNPDWYWLNVPGPFCGKVTVTVMGNSTPGFYPFGRGLIPSLSVYSEDCDLLEEIVIGDVANDAMLVDLCLTPGIHYVQVTSNAANPLQAAGPYILAFSECTPCTCCTYPSKDYEPNELCDIGYMNPIVCGDTLCGEIEEYDSAGGAWDYYDIIVNGVGPCALVNIDVFGTNSPFDPQNAGLHPRVSLYEFDCSYLYAQDETSGAWGDARLSSCVPPGNYKVRVEGVGGSTGPYTIAVQCHDCTCPVDTTNLDLGGGNNDFLSFAAAAAYLDSVTIVGPVIVNVYPGTYNEQVVLGEVNGASEVNTITFKKAPDPALTNPVVQWNGTIVVTFDNADYYVWSGINVAHLGTGIGAAIAMTNDADYNVVQNCALTNTQSASATWGVYIQAAANSALTNDGNLYEDLTISGFSTAVRLGDEAGLTSSQTANEVRNCVITNGANGVVAGCQRGLRIHGNDISVSHPNYTTVYGVNIGQLNATDSVSVYDNNIHGLSGSVAYGIYAATFQPNSMVSIYNNMIHSWNAGVCQSIVVRQNARAVVHFNSLYMNESPVATYYYGIGGGEAANITISNNIFYSDATSDTTYAVANGSLVTFTTNNNCFYGIGSRFYVGYYLVRYQTLPAWQATGRDLNSIFEVPGYASASDLHIDGYYTACDASAVPIGGILTDIDGDLRDPAMPDIGADEFTGLPGPINNLVISLVPNSSDIQLNWGSVPGAVSYKIYRHTDQAALAPIPAYYIGTTTTNSYLDVGIVAQPNVMQFYLVKASTLP